MYLTIHTATFVAIIALILLPGLLYCNSGESDDNNVNTLVLLHVLFRHGDRTPDRAEIYPKDMYKQVGSNFVEYGQLTKQGRHREYLIGKALRKRYDKFLGLYVYNTIVALATDYTRTKMSCLLALAGLYPPTPEQIWEEGVPWQPIPYTYERYDRDEILGNPLHYCPSFKALYAEFISSPEGERFYNENKEAYNYISYHTGWDIKTPKLIYDLYFLLKSKETMGLKLPEWTKSVWPTNITNLATDQYFAECGTPRMLRIAAGYFINHMLNETEAKINGLLPPQRKIYLYSGHEFNIAFFLKALGLFEPHIPPFGSYVVTEIHKIQGVYGIKIFYQDYKSSPSEPKLLKLVNCDTFCPFDHFKQIVKQYLPLPYDCKRNIVQCETKIV